MDIENNKHNGPYLSFSDGRPIARIEKGQHDHNILYICDPDIDIKAGCATCGGKKKTCKGGCGGCGEKCKINKDIPFDELAYLFENFFKHIKGKISFIKINKVIHHIKNNFEPEEEDLKELYLQAKQILAGSRGKELILHEGEMIPVPNPFGRECPYICGQSGSGKSTYAANYMREYKKIFPKNKVYLFSRKNEDEVLDKHKPIRIKLDDELVDNPIHPEELKNSLCIFDDIDTIPNKKIKNGVSNLVDDLLEIGRASNIYVIRISHLINNYKETRKVLNECTSITLFPGGSSSYAIKYALKTYFGFETKQIEKVLKLPSRWITIHKNFPMTLLYAKGAYIVN